MTKRGVYALPQLSLPKLNDRPPTGSLMLDRQAGRLCAMKRGIPIFRGQTRFSFRRRYPYLQLPMPCVPLHPPARRAIYNFQLCPENVVTLFFFTVVALIASNVAARVRAQAVTAREWGAHHRGALSLQPQARRHRDFRRFALGHRASNCLDAQSPLTASPESQGYLVSSAGDARTALALVRRGAADLLVLDLGLPDMDGLDVVERIRESGAALPIIILSSRGKESAKVEALIAAPTIT